MRSPTRIALTLVAALATLTAACTTSADVVAPTEPTPSPQVTSDPAPNPTAPPATATPLPAPVEPTATPTQAPANTPEPTPLATSLPNLPGEAWDLWVPLRGETVAVVGVAYDDILEVHVAPGENSPLVGTLEPLADTVVSTGEGRSLPSSIWWRVTLDDLDGWVGSRFMTRLGDTVDITAQVVDSIGTIPSAETMTDLGMIVANDRASEDPPSNIVVTVAPTVGDLGEIVIDVVGYPDDAVKGERLHIFGQPTEDGEGFSLKSIEATVMCRRGVTEDGLCL